MRTRRIDVRRPGVLSRRLLEYQWTTPGLLRSCRVSDDLTRPSEQSGWVYACIGAVVEACLSMPLQVVRDDSRDAEVVESGPVYDLMMSPSREITPSMFLESIYTQMMLAHGESYIVGYDADGFPLREYAPRALPDQLFVLQPGVGSPVVNADRLVAYQAGTGYPFAPDAVIHPMRYSPYRLYQGLGPLAVASMAADMVYQGTNRNRNFAINSSSPGGWIQFDGHLTTENRRRFREQHEEEFGGARNSGRLAIYPKGMTFVPTPLDNESMQFAEMMGWGRSEIAAIFRVPLGIIASEATRTYATAQVEERDLFLHAAIPVCDRVADAINWWLRARGVPERVRFSADDIESLVESRLSRIDRIGQLTLEGWTPLQASEYLELRLPPPEGEDLEIDDVPAADESAPAAPPPSMGEVAAVVTQVAAGTLPSASAVEILVLAGVDRAQAQAMVAPAAAAQVTEPDAEPDPEPDPEPDEEPEPERRSLSNLAVRRSSRADRRRDLRSRERTLIVPGERRIARDHRSIIRSQMADTLRWLRGRPGAREIEHRLTESDLTLLEGMWAGWDSAMRSHFARTALSLVRVSAESAAEAIGVSMTFDPADPRWVQIQGDMIASLVQTNETTREGIRSSLIRSLAEGMTPLETERAIAADALFSVGRSRTIARTEMGMMADAAQHQEFLEAGITRHAWVSAGDDLVRQSHVSVDGEERDVGERFSNGLLHPHEVGAAAGEVIQCRCGTQAIS